MEPAETLEYIKKLELSVTYNKKLVNINNIERNNVD